MLQDRTIVLYVVLNNSLLNYMTAHLTSLIQLAILVFFSQIKFLLSLNPAILIFWNFVVSVFTLISKQPVHRYLDCPFQA